MTLNEALSTLSGSDIAASVSHAQASATISTELAVLCGVLCFAAVAIIAAGIFVSRIK